MFADVTNVFCPIKWRANADVTEGVGVVVDVFVGVCVCVGLTVGVIVGVIVVVGVFVGVRVRVGVTLEVGAGVMGITSPSTQPFVSSIFITILFSA